MSAPTSPNASGHRSVLAASAVEHLVTTPDGTYVDATFGRGGHSRLILARLSARGRLVAFDRDPAAVAAAQAIADPRFHVEHTAFSHLRATLQALQIDAVQGVLLDIGVSSPQIDDPLRGFSLRMDGPLDMRMDPSHGETAAEWLARATVDELTQVIRDYGEERFAASIAKAIVARRAAGRSLSTTADLAAVVADAIPVKSRKDALQHPATRTFQAVRIHVNQELEELALALEQAASMLAIGGRLVVISFHSLEDRVVKRFIDRRAHPDRAVGAARRLPLRAAELPRPTLLAVARVLPGDEEIAANPRARSAVMRVAERTAEPWREEPLQ
ncbi:MAG: 16S rRNA (cytosine(1402)-N(4))-methyltransferase RsmH [Burkholderiaceae bacterium]|jgi:16S rRNA (cytosine1402-N4)-methyltransferase|nr:16S rRNA (cytosine(1402)-N(4))-methyltransferase RsmH [Burkholderiaceae bacterium]